MRGRSRVRMAEAIRNTIDGNIESIILNAFDEALEKGQNKIAAYSAGVDAYARFKNIRRSTAAEVAVDIIISKRSSLRSMISELDIP
jgi:hypothetical protein